MCMFVVSRCACGLFLYAYMCENTDGHRQVNVNQRSYNTIIFVVSLAIFFLCDHLKLQNPTLIMASYILVYNYLIDQLVSLAVP